MVVVQGTDLFFIVDLLRESAATPYRRAAPEKLRTL
jgi:hypothetical protein